MGRKAVIVKPSDEGTTDKPFSHALVAGIDRYPRKVTKKMSKKKVSKRSKIKPFLKVVNYNHMMPTRYSVDISFDKTNINKELLKDPMKKKKARNMVRTKFEERYKSGKNRWFFQKLKFKIRLIFSTCLYFYGWSRCFNISCLSPSQSQSYFRN